MNNKNWEGTNDKKDYFKLLLMRLMKSMNMNARFTAEVVTFLKTDEEKSAMLLYLKEHYGARQEDIREVATDIMKAAIAFNKR